jgi:hypothetical protein
MFKSHTYLYDALFFTDATLKTFEFYIQTRQCCCSLTISYIRHVSIAIGSRNDVINIAWFLIRT